MIVRRVKKRVILPDAHPTRKAIIVSVDSEKGGVGKTTTLANLAMMLVLQGNRVLVVDADAPGHLGFSLGYERDYLETTGYEALLAEARTHRPYSLRDSIVPTYADASSESVSFFDPQLQILNQYKKPEEIIEIDSTDLDAMAPTALEIRQQRGAQLIQGPYLLPISSAAYNADSELKADVTWYFSMRTVLKKVESNFDYILIDTNPSAGCLMTLALVASQFFYTPIVPELLPLQGIVNLFRNVNQLKQVHPTLEFTGIVFTKVQTYVEHKDIMQQLQGALQPQFPSLNVSFFQTQIMQTKAGVSAGNARSLAVIHDPQSDHAKSYWYFLEELLSRVGGPAVESTVQTVQNLRRSAG